MKYALILVAFLMCLTGYGVNSSNSNAPNLTPTANPAASTTHDMLIWMTMRPNLRANYHMAGTANPLYTSITPDRFYWTKTAGGYPWDIRLYDKNYTYLWVTELDWQNPRTFKAFTSPTLGKFDLPFAPRFAKGGILAQASKSSTPRMRSILTATPLSQEI